jgi:hypothetical protein
MVAIGVVGGSVVWLLGAMGPAQPDQAVLTEKEVTVQAPSGGKAAAVGDAYPVASVQLAQWSDREGDRSGADPNREGVRGLVAAGRPKPR